MIVKIENLEQEKYVLECAEKDGCVWCCGGEKPTEWTLSKRSCIFPFNIAYENVLSINYEEITHTFEQFKAQREQNEFIKQNDELTKQNDLEKENKELENKLDEIRKHVCYHQETLDKAGLSKYGEGRLLELNKIEIILQTPEQTEAKELIEKTDSKVLEELKKLL